MAITLQSILTPSPGDARALQLLCPWQEQVPYQTLTARADPAQLSSPRALQGSDSFPPALSMKTSFFPKSQSMSEPHEASARLLESFGEPKGALCDSTQQQACPCRGGRGHFSRLHGPAATVEPLIPGHFSCWTESGHVRNSQWEEENVPLCFQQTVWLREQSNNRAGTRLFAQERGERAGRGHSKHRRLVQQLTQSSGCSSPLRRPPGLLSPFCPPL